MFCWFQVLVLALIAVLRVVFTNSAFGSIYDTLIWIGTNVGYAIIVPIIIITNFLGGKVSVLETVDCWKHVYCPLLTQAGISTKVGPVHLSPTFNIYLIRHWLFDDYRQALYSDWDSVHNWPGIWIKNIFWKMNMNQICMYSETSWFQSVLFSVFVRVSCLFHCIPVNPSRLGFWVLWLTGGKVHSTPSMENALCSVWSTFVCTEAIKHI